MLTKLTVVTAAAWLAISCSAPSAPATNDSHATIGANEAESAAITDPQIAHVAYTAGNIDIEAARQALGKTRDARVRAFAETMLREHQSVNEQALALVEKLGVTPEQNPTSIALSAQAAEKLRTLAGLEGAAFDRAYAENEAAFHATVNDALRTTLIPGATNAELKALLETGLALFSAHQTHAEQLAQQLR
jgi:putative membrane protein